MKDKEIFDDFNWHSAVGFDDFHGGESISGIENTASNRGMFVEADDGLLIHKTTKALWRQSDDGSSIVPMFEDDILTADDLKSMEEER